MQRLHLCNVHETDLRGSSQPWLASIADPAASQTANEHCWSIIKVMHSHKGRTLRVDQGDLTFALGMVHALIDRANVGDEGDSRVINQ